MYVRKLHKRPVQGIPDTYNDHSSARNIAAMFTRVYQ